MTMRYDLMTDPFPLQAGPAAGAQSAAVLTVVASNQNPDPDRNPITLQGLSVMLLVGPDAADLTADASGVGPVAPPGWKLHETKKSDNKVEYVFGPEAGQGAVGGQGLAFVFNNITPNTQPGPTTVTIKEGSAANPTTQLPLTKFPNGWGSVEFRLDKNDLNLGDPTTLNWSGPAGATYTIEYAAGGRVVNVPAQGESALGNQGQYPAQGDPPLTLDRTTVFTLSVEETISDVRYQAQLQKTATVLVPAPTLKLTVAPSVVEVFDPQPVQLQWTTTNVSVLSIDGVGIYTGPQAEGGSATDSPPVRRPNEPHVYTATASGLDGYVGPPATAMANVTFDWTQTVKTIQWGGFPFDGQVQWSLTMKDGRRVLDLVSEIVHVSFVSFRCVSAQLPPGALAADLGTVGAAAAHAEVSAASFGDVLPNAILLLQNHTAADGMPLYTPMNVNQTWAVKFPDGFIMLVWYAGVELGDLHGVAESVEFTLGRMPYDPLPVSAAEEARPLAASSAAAPEATTEPPGAGSGEISND